MIINTILRKTIGKYIILAPLTRPSTSFVKFLFGDKPLHIIEIGVLDGENALRILKTLNVAKLYLIDPFEKYEGYDDRGCNVAEKYFEYTKKLLSPYKDKVVFIRKKSSDAMEDIPDGLDFIYIDGNHKYEYVKEDIKNYYPKLKEGGVLGGHDIDIDWINTEHDGVPQAFCEFVIKKNLKPYIKAPDWWVVKGKRWR